jgi:hypothetical protein
VLEIRDRFSEPPCVAQEDEELESR